MITRIISRTIMLLLLLLTFGSTSLALAQNYNVIDAKEGGVDAWPQQVVGTYTENGTLNGKPCYDGPNGYKLYFAQCVNNYWYIGKGSSDINDANVRFYISSSQCHTTIGYLR